MKPAIMRSSVVLPQPDGPRIEKKLPRCDLERQRVDGDVVGEALDDAARLEVGRAGDAGVPANPGVPSGVSLSSYTPDLNATMSLLKPLTAYATKGASSLQIGVILPDTTSSVR